MYLLCNILFHLMHYSKCSSAGTQCIRFLCLQPDRQACLFKKTYIMITKQDPSLLVPLLLTEIKGVKQKMPNRMVPF